MEDTSGRVLTITSQNTNLHNSTMIEYDQTEIFYVSPRQFESDFLC